MLRRSLCSVRCQPPSRPTVAPRVRRLATTPNHAAPPSPSPAAPQSSPPAGSSSAASSTARPYSRFAHPIEYSEARKRSGNPEVILRTQRMEGHFRNQQTSRGEVVFQSMLSDGLELDEQAWTTVLNGWAANQRLDKVRETIELMKSRGVPIHLQAWGVLMKALIGMARVQEAMALLNQLETNGPKPDLITYNLVLTHLARFPGMSKPAAQIWERISTIAEPDEVSYRGYIQLLGEDGQFNEVPKVLREMRLRNFSMGMKLFTPLIKSAFRHKRPDLVDFFVTELGGAVPDAPLATVLVKGYWRARDRDRLFPLIQYLRKEGRLDVYLYASIAEIYLQSEMPDAVLELPKEMQARNLRPSNQSLELGGMVIDAALKARTAQQCVQVLEQLWQFGWPTPPPKGELVVKRLRDAGLTEEADRLAAEVEAREYERLARRIRREVVLESEGRPLYLPKVPTKRVYWANQDGGGGGGQGGGGGGRGGRGAGQATSRLQHKAPPGRQ